MTGKRSAMLFIHLCVTSVKFDAMDRIDFDSFKPYVDQEAEYQTTSSLDVKYTQQYNSKKVSTNKESKHVTVVSEQHKTVVHLNSPKITTTTQVVEAVKAEKEMDLEAIKDCLQKLPQKNRPADVEQALQMVKDGAKVATMIDSDHFYDAVARSIKAGTLSAKSEQIFQKAFNLSDMDFWNLIKNDKLLAKKASHHAIPFTFESLQSVENAMYFRATYARIYSGKASFEAFASAYQTAIVQLQWYFYGKAVLQDGKAFSSGMISIKDPNNKMFTFLDGYAELVSPKYKLHASMSIHSFVTTKAYTRKSSHYTGAKRFAFDCGIDIQDNNNQPLTILPGNKSHLLFGIRSNDMLFVKWENYGVTFNPLEGDISLIPHIKGYLDKKDLNDDPNLERREKVTDDVWSEFKKLYGNKKISAQEQKSIDAHGISYLLTMLDPASRELFQKYLVHVKQYPADSLKDRKGNEIILSGPEK